MWGRVKPVTRPFPYRCSSKWRFALKLYNNYYNIDTVPTLHISNVNHIYVFLFFYSGAVVCCLGNMLYDRSILTGQRPTFAETNNWHWILWLKTGQALYYSIRMVSHSKLTTAYFPLWMSVSMRHTYETLLPSVQVLASTLCNLYWLFPLFRKSSMK